MGKSRLYTFQDKQILMRYMYKKYYCKIDKNYIVVYIANNTEATITYKNIELHHNDNHASYSNIIQKLLIKLQQELFHIQKQNILRYSLLGKRLEFINRTIISYDNFLEISLPKVISQVNI